MGIPQLEVISPLAKRQFFCKFKLANLPFELTGFILSIEHLMVIPKASQIFGSHIHRLTVRIVFIERLEIYIKGNGTFQDAAAFDPSTTKLPKGLGGIFCRWRMPTTA